MHIVQLLTCRSIDLIFFSVECILTVRINVLFYCTFGNEPVCQINFAIFASPVTSHHLVTIKLLSYYCL